MAHYYNEFDPHAAEWLRRLMRAGLIPEGEVDERPIQEVRATDLRGFVQCHFFAGIGGWCEALRLAGWPEGRPVWTGSCPCQPFSPAGKRKAQTDDRHLWPHFFSLIRECRPECVIGEQVEGAVGHGWLDGVQADLEGEGYAVGSAVLGAHSVGADHKRQRLYWVADRQSDGYRAVPVGGSDQQGEAEGREFVAGRHGDAGWVADAGQIQRGRWSNECRPSQQDEAERHEETVHNQRCGSVGANWCVGDTDEGGWSEGDTIPRRPATGVGVSGSPRGVEHATSDGRGEGWPESGGRGVAGGRGDGFWDASELIHCRDGKVRRIPQGGVESGLFPLAHGVSGRVAVSRPGKQTVAPHHEGEEVRWVNRAGALRGAGNAIVPQVAAEFVMAFMEVNRERSGLNDNVPLAPVVTGVG